MQLAGFCPNTCLIRLRKIDVKKNDIKNHLSQRDDVRLPPDFAKIIQAMLLTIIQREILFGYKQRKFSMKGRHTKTHIRISQRNYDEFRKMKNTHRTAPRFLIRNAAACQNPSQIDSYSYPIDNDCIM